MAAATPNIDKFMNSGEYSYDSDAGVKLACGPAWATLLTGVDHKSHGVTNDEFKKMDLETYPHFFDELSGTDFRTASVVHLPLIQQHLDCCSDISLIGMTDETVMTKSIDIIGGDKADVLFLQFNDVDEAGRLSAYSPNEGVYLKAIGRMDARFGQLLEAVQTHAKQMDEEWMILICSDHGGEGQEHEGQQKLREVRMVPQVMAFCDAQGKIRIELEGSLISMVEASNLSVVPTVLEYLRIPVPEYMEGVPYIVPAASTEW